MANTSYASNKCHIDRLRCDCHLCADVPEKERVDEPAQDPMTWHLPVASGKTPIVLGRLFNFEKLGNFIVRHMSDDFLLMRCVKAGADSSDEENDTPAARDARESPTITVTIPTAAGSREELGVINRGVILKVRGDKWGKLSMYSDMNADCYAGRVSNLLRVYPGAIDDPTYHDYFEIDLVGQYRNVGEGAARKDAWNWDPRGWRDRTVVSAEAVFRGAKSYKREFYDWPRVNMMCLRKLVDQKRAAPPGYLLIKGSFVKPRRTSREKGGLDTGLLSKLFDRSSLHDICFKFIVGYLGTLEPGRPWRYGAKWGSWDTLQ